MGIVSKPPVFLEMQTDTESVISSSLCSVNRRHQEAVRLLKVQSAEGRDQQQKSEKFTKGTSLCSSESRSVSRRHRITVGPVTVSCRKGL